MSKEAKKIEAPRFENYPDIVTVKQLKEMLGVGNNQALNLIHDNKIKHFRIGRISFAGISLGIVAFVVL